MQFSLRTYQSLNIINDSELPIHADINTNTPSRLKSRHPPLLHSLSLNSNNFNINDKWLLEWNENAPLEWRPIKNDNQHENPSGFDLPRKLWCTINIIRTNHGKCKDLVDSPTCDCDNGPQTIRHITFDCPRRAYDGERNDFINISQDVLDWMERLDIRI